MVEANKIGAANTMLDHCIKQIEQHGESATVTITVGRVCRGKYIREFGTRGIIVDQAEGKTTAQFPARKVAEAITGYLVAVDPCNPRIKHLVGGIC